MSQPELNRKLQDLHAELTRTNCGGVDAQAERLLAELKEDIEAVLERRTAVPSDGLSERLRQLVQRFESTHPALAGAMGAVADQLSKLGI